VHEFPQSAADAPRAPPPNLPPARRGILANPRVIGVGEKSCTGCTGVCRSMQAPFAEICPFPDGARGFLGAFLKARAPRPA